MVAAGYTTVVIAATATEIKISVDGAPFTHLANATIPVLAATLMDLGSTTGTADFLNGEIMWGALGIGDLTDADAAAIAALGNTQPYYSDFANTTHLSAVLPFDDNSINIPG
jgi:hypothetical protein